MLTLSAQLDELSPDLFGTLTKLHWLYVHLHHSYEFEENAKHPLSDLASTGIQCLPPTLIRNNVNLKHLRLNNNAIQRIPRDFFVNAGNLSSLILSHNQIESVDFDVFHPLQSLKDIHLQQNTRWEMYCGYGFADSSRFPELAALYIHGMAHRCVPQWVNDLRRDRPDLEIELERKEKLEMCPAITIEDLPRSVPQHTSLLLQFEGPSLFLQHRAYWISKKVNSCSDFRGMMLIQPARKYIFCSVRRH